MSKLVYGKQGQVRFLNEMEKKEAFDYLLQSDNVDFVHEHNEEQGAWASEHRIQFRKPSGVPECLKRNMTAGRDSLYGRINCKELFEEIVFLKSHDS